MKKLNFMLVLLIIISSMGIVISATGSPKTIRVYGEISIDGDGVEGAYVTVEDDTTHDKATDTTNGTGFYEVFILSRDDHKIIVTVEHDSYKNDKGFIVERFNSNYELNFEFESSDGIIIVSKTVDWFYEFINIDPRDFLFYFILTLVSIILLSKVIHPHKRKYKYKD